MDHFGIEKTFTYFNKCLTSICLFDLLAFESEHTTNFWRDL